MRRIGSWLWSNRSVAVFLGAIAFSLPGAVRLAQRIVALAPLSYEERRNRELGELYVSLRANESTLPPGDVSVLLIGPHAVDRGIFVNYHLYPRASHLYFDALPADAPRRPLLVTEANGPVRRTVSRALPLSRGAHRELLVPLVAALQGADGYATEAIFEAATRTSVTLTLMPSGATKTLALRANEPLILGDVVYEAFGVMTTGWLRVRADEPVRAAFALANRGRAVSTAMPIVTHMPPLPHRFARGQKLWVLNPGTTAVTARIDGREEVIDAGALRTLQGSEVDAERPLISFASTKMSDGNTTFVWPRGME
jgi:hypothetical protein